MSFEPITVSSFNFYVRHLKQDLKAENDLKILVEPFFQCLLNESITEISAFFNDKNKSIEEVAHLIYKVLKCSEDNSKDNTCSIEFLVQIKTILRLIKYSCTIFEETKHSRFYDNTTFELMVLDNQLDPTEWVFISNSQFMVKVLYSIGNNNIIARICPITDYKLGNVFDVHSGRFGNPLLILDDDSFGRSIDKLVNKYALKNDDENNKFPRRVYTDCLYIGSLEHNFAKTYTNSFKPLYDSLKDVFTKHYKEYEAIVTSEYVFNRYGISTCVKIFIFKKERDIGYVLHSFITGKKTDKYKFDISFINAMPKDLINDVLNTMYDESKKGNKTEESNSSELREIFQGKMYKIVENLKTRFNTEAYNAIVPNFVIFPC